MRKFLTLAVVAALFTPAVLSAQDKKKPDPEAQFAKLDANNDKKLSLEEFKGKRTGDKADKAGEQFKKMDKDSDGFLTLEEFKARGKKAK
ncbi:MAG TPA: EF-hand domain-containing protein [Pirellulaceae bacterium]|nr:EF-hand domain-containing protein [Pirellulaceae bacterium]